MLHKERFTKNITFKGKNTKTKLKGQSRVVKYSFSGNKTTKLSGLHTVAKYRNKQGIVKSISTLSPTDWHSATKFTNQRHFMPKSQKNKVF